MTGQSQDRDERTGRRSFGYWLDVAFETPWPMVALLVGIGIGLLTARVLG